MRVQRQEFKYYISDDMSQLISMNLKKILAIDKNYQEGKKSYVVTSLYFDDSHSSALTEKLDGILAREKYRIRMYDSEVVSLKAEIKRKIGTVVDKRSWPIRESTVKSILDGTIDLLSEDSRSIVDFAAKVKGFGQLPRVIVEYDRQAFQHPLGDLRITIDSNLRTCNSFTNILNLKSVPRVPVFLKGAQILEVKFSGEFPQFVSDLLSCYPLTRSAISKYVICQRYVDSSGGRDYLGDQY